MSLTDLPEVMAIELEICRSPWSLKIFQDCLRVGYEGWVVYLGFELLAYGLLSEGALGEVHLLNLGVKRPYQGQGLGRHLLQHIIESCRQRGSVTIYLEVRISNTHAMHLYRRLGFNEIAIRKHYYHDPDGGYEDAQLMALTLLPTHDKIP